MSYGKFIQEQRESLGLSHDEMAEKIGISRSSYFALERDDKKLTFEQAAKTASALGISIDELLTLTIPNPTKYRHMILAFLRKAKESGEILKKTKLAKLLYFADFAWYHKHQSSISGMRYRKIEYGPVPDTYFRILDELALDEKIDIEKVSDGDRTMFQITETFVSEIEDLDTLSSEQHELIDRIWSKWKTSNTNQIVQYTHNQHPYKSVEYGQIIPYETILEEKPEHIY